MGGGRSREVKRANPFRRERGSDELDGVGIAGVFGARRAGEGADVDGWIVEKRERRFERPFGKEGLVALQIDGGAMAAMWVERPQGFADAIAAAGVRAARKRRVSADRLDRARDLRRVGRDHDRSERRGACALPDMDDHGPTVDFGERLAGQTRRA